MGIPEVNPHSKENSPIPIPLKKTPIEKGCNYPILPSSNNQKRNFSKRKEKI
jgi:hypothetical protein